MSDDDGISRSEYWQQIEHMADVVQEHVDGSDVEPPEAVFEEVDNHQWVIYTGYSLDVLRFSDGPSDEWHVFVDDDETDHHRVLQAMAFSAMRQDVYDELSSRDQFTW